MATSNDNETMIEVPVVRGKNGGIDVKQTLVNAERVAKEFAAQDSEATNAVVATTNLILNDEKYKEVKSMTASTLAKMVLGKLAEIPTDKLCAETEERVEAFLQGQPDKFLHIPRGRNSGFHFISRYSAEELAKLQKSKASDEAAAAK